MERAAIENPYDYDLHFRLIQECRDAKDFIKARDYRNYANSIFPFSSVQWKEWIQDEIELDPMNFSYFLQLYQKAVSEVYDVELWEEYLDFVLDQEPITGTVSDILQNSISVIGWHFTNGFKIWEKMLAFQIDNTQGNEDVDKLRSLFFKRVEMPMSDASFDSLLIQYSGFESKFGTDYENSMKKFNAVVFNKRKECKKRDYFEQKLIDSDYSLLNFFKYIEYEKKQKQTQVFSIKSLFERAITYHPLDVSIWDSYIAFLISSLRVETVIMSVIKRAIRYCYWEPKIWIHYMIALTMYKCSTEELNEEIERAINMTSASPQSIDLLSIFLDLFYSRREQGISSLDDHFAAFDKALELTEKYKIKDLECCLLITYASFYYDEKHDIDTARELLEKAVKKCSKLASVWLSYIDLEKRANGKSSPKLRALYKRALQVKNLDRPELIQKGILKYEILQNDYNNYYSAYDRICSLNAVPPVIDNYQLGHIEESSKRTLEDGNSPPKKRMNNHDPMQIEQVVQGEKKKDEVIQYHVIENLMAGNMLYIPLVNSRVDENLIREVFEKFGKIVDILIQPSASGELETFVEFENADQVRSAVSNAPRELQGSPIQIFRCRPSQKVWNFQAKQEDEKIYISNLSPNMDKKTLREAFSAYGKIKEIRLITRKTTAFAYIDYANKNAAIKSLEMDQKMLEPPRKISVAISNPSKQAVKEIDDRELYVSNLPLSMAGEEDVSTLFAQFGIINQIRIVKTPAGRSTGTAFVTFESVESAKKALSLNGSLVDGRTVIVSIADPNIRSRKKLEKYQDRDKQVFLPRAALKSKPKSKVQVASSETSSMQVESKSQDDFRRMFGIGN